MREGTDWSSPSTPLVARAATVKFVLESTALSFNMVRFTLTLLRACSDNCKLTVGSSESCDTFTRDIVGDEEEQRLRVGYNVTFPDVPEAITCGWSWKEAVEMAIDVLEVALSYYVDEGKEIPLPSPPAEGQIMVPVPPLPAAKLSLYTAMREQGVSSAELANRLEVGESDIRHMVDLTHRTPIRHVEIALLALGRALALEDWHLPAPPGSPELIGSEAGALR